MTPHVRTTEPCSAVLADGRGGSGHEDKPTRRAILRMVLGTAGTLVTIIIGGYFACVRLA